MSPFLQRLDRRDALAVAGALVLTTIVFANGLRGDFILDDQKQIVRNDLIRSPRFWRQALTRDVWAFHGDREKAWSNYWRPGHVAWLILNYQLFGPRPLPWHITNLLAHLGVVACAYVLVRRLGATLGVATTIVCLFAVHPTRVESVTWIAGVHDVLATLWQLLALICLMSLWRRPALGMKPLAGFASACRWLAAVAFYALAISTKEIAVFFPLIVGLVRFTDPNLHESPWGARRKRTIGSAVPFVVVALLFLSARWLVLRGAQLQFPWQPGLRTMLTSLPIVICFYLRQIVFPWWIGWSYPLRAVHDPGIGNFFVPLAILVVLVALAQRLIRSRIQLIGAAIFALTLLPALNIKAFIPEQIVKDRYLYLPLLGFLMAVVPLIAGLLQRAFGARSTIIGGATASILVILLGIRTVHYNFAWHGEITLWESAVHSDPTSVTNRCQLGVAYMLAGRLDEARVQMDKSLERFVTSDALTARAELSIKQTRYNDAVEDCRTLLKLHPDSFRAYERLAVALERRGKLEEAAQALREARVNVPYRTAVFTDQLAVILYRQGRKDEALRELESVRLRASQEFAPGSRLALFRLGMLYRELGRVTESSDTLRQFLQLTEGSGDPNIVEKRQIALRTLGPSLTP